MKVIIFGTGMLYQNFREQVKREDIVAFIDNDSKKQGKFLDGVKIYNPQYVLQLLFDKIILMSSQFIEMKQQLLDIGVSEDKIWTWRRYESELSRGVLKLFCYHDYKANYKKRVLVISTHLDYNGGTLAAVRAVQALQLKGYQTVLAAPSGNQEFIDEMSQKGINIVLCTAIWHLSKTEMCWINQFDVVLVNVFQMVACACEISQYKPVLWWIHEPSMSYCGIYERIRKEFGQYDNVLKMKQINIVAVSKIAKRNFEVYYPGIVKHTLLFGIPDEFISEMNTESIESKDKCTFAIIGNIEERKAQKIFIQAILKFSREEIDQLEFLVIGGDYAHEYCREVKKMAEEAHQIKFLGQLPREEMKTIFQKIDVVVCASMEETMSIAIVEGMMHNKLCITTDATGIADYINHGENGFICKAGDVDSLWMAMKWIVDHKNESKSIRKNARKTYEKYFTMESFSERLEELIHETEENYFYHR